MSYKIVSFAGELLVDVQITDQNIEDLYNLYQSYFLSCDGDDSFDLVGVLDAKSLEPKLSLLSLIDTHGFAAVMEKLKAIVESESDGDSYKDGFEEIFTKDALIRNIIMDGDTTDLNDILDLIEGISPEFKLDDALTKDINGVLTLYEEALNVFLVENGRAAKPLGEFIRFRSKKKALEGCFKMMNSLTSERRVPDIIEDFNKAYNQCLTFLARGNHLDANQSEKLKQKSILESYATQITDLGEVDQNGRKINYPTFSIEESAQTLFKTSFQELTKTSFKALEDYCGLILLKTNDSTPPAQSENFTTFVIKKRFGHLRLGIMSIKGGPLFIYYAQNIGPNDHSRYRGDMKTFAQTAYESYLDRNRSDSSEESGSPVLSDQDVCSVRLGGSKKPRNKPTIPASAITSSLGGGSAASSEWRIVPEPAVDVNIVAFQGFVPNSDDALGEGKYDCICQELKMICVEGCHKATNKNNFELNPKLDPMDYSEDTIRKCTYKYAYGFFINHKLDDLFKRVKSERGAPKQRFKELESTRNCMSSLVPFVDTITRLRKNVDAVLDLKTFRCKLDLEPILGLSDAAKELSLDDLVAQIDKLDVLNNTISDVLGSIETLKEYDLEPKFKVFLTKLSVRFTFYKDAIATLKEQLDEKKKAAKVATLLASLDDTDFEASVNDLAVLNSSFVKIKDRVADDWSITKVIACLSVSAYSTEPFLIEKGLELVVSSLSKVPVTQVQDVVHFFECLKARPESTYEKSQVQDALLSYKHVFITNPSLRSALELYDAAILKEFDHRFREDYDLSTLKESVGVSSMISLVSLGLNYFCGEQDDVNPVCIVGVFVCMAVASSMKLYKKGSKK